MRATPIKWLVGQSLFLWCILCTQCAGKSPAEFEFNGAVLSDAESVLRDKLQVYGLDESFPSFASKSPAVPSDHDRLFEAGERLIQTAMHEEENPARLSEMRKRILELVQRPSQRDSDPAVAYTPNHTESIRYNLLQSTIRITL